MSSLTNEMKSEIKKLWNALWSGGIANPLEAMEQISYFLYMRRLSSMDAEARKMAEFAQKEHISIFEKDDTCKWNYFKHLEGEEMLRHVNDTVFPWMKSSLMSKGDLFAEAMRDSRLTIDKGSLMIQMVNTIDKIYSLIDEEVHDTGQNFYDIQGDIYEEFLSEIATAGKNGQFRTPRHIIQMMASMMKPRLGELICDPAAGTGGFILAAYQQILSNYTSKEFCVKDRFGFYHGTLGDKITNPKNWEYLENETFHCFDFDRTMVRLGIMNLVSHGLESPNFTRKDTLSKSFNQFNKYNLILANPPFKGNLDEGDIWNESKLSTTRTELLFVDRIIQMLTKGGRAAVIVPDGVLSSSQSKAHTALRKSLVDDHGLKAMISLPPGVFKPYAGVSTGILIFTKGDQTENVWFYDMENDGFSLDDMRDKIPDCDIPDVLENWENITNGNDIIQTSKSFFVSKKRIQENDYNLSVNKYKDIVHEKIQFDHPLIITAKMKQLEAKIMSDIEDIEQFFKD